MVARSESSTVEGQSRNDSVAFIHKTFRDPITKGGEKMFEILGYLESSECIGCDKPDKECVVLRCEAFSGPHCARCTMREAKKRQKNRKQDSSPLNERA